MNIGGFLKQSFVDYDGMISSVIFTNGCNLNCWYCHNHQLIPLNNKNRIKLPEIYSFLKSRKNFIDGVVISGGEPTLQPDLEDVIDEIKKMGFKVKLDTNGTNPDILFKLLPKLDYVAMDIKNSLENYHKVTGKIDISKIEESIDILKNWDKDYEFRTTLCPDITLKDIESIGKILKGAKKYVIQHYNAQTPEQPKQSLQMYEKALKMAKKYINNCFIR